MCGIAGIVEFATDAPVDEGALRRMCATMFHRGPDEEGFDVRGRVGLGMRRLSIIDLKTGQQPMTNEDGSLWLVYNGEIYNHLSLREQMLARGHAFRTHCDTETIVHLYEEYGRDCVQHLRGMFAFALWDARRHRLFAARDRLGIKPFYYRKTADRFLFGSEIKVILAHPGVAPQFNRVILPEYLAFGYLSGADTFFTGIRKLMPGHTLELDESGDLRIEPYWDLMPAGGAPPHPESYYVEAYRDLLEQAVGSHLMSDVPLGVFLSGGVDSSAVAALMTKIRRAPVETFSVGYAEESYSELPYARAVAGHLKSLHHEVQVSCQEFFDALPKLIWHEDEPIVWPSSVALYFVARLARERVTVVLTGEGADETLAGYSRYAFSLKNVAFDRAYRHMVPGTLRRGIRGLIAESPLLHATLRRKLEHTFLAKDGESWASFYFDNFFSAFSGKDQAELLADGVSAGPSALAAYINVLQTWERAPGELLQRLLYTDIKTYLVELLMKQDNMSMAASIESRVPFLDHLLVEFALSIPQHLQVRGLAGKRILKRAVEDLLPRSILYRPKLGFPTPWSGWLAGPSLDRIQSLVMEPRAIDRGLFRPAAVKRLFQEHRRKYRDHYDRIWRLLNLELWFRVFLEGEPHEAGMKRLEEPKSAVALAAA
jgi:asparagine synthase (glutamine-hydrolysing)